MSIIGYNISNIHIFYNVLFVSDLYYATVVAPFPLTTILYGSIYWRDSE